MALHSADPWDDIRLIDFGLAERCIPGMASLYLSYILVLVRESYETCVDI